MKYFKLPVVLIIALFVASSCLDFVLEDPESPDIPPEGTPDITEIDPPELNVSSNNVYNVANVQINWTAVAATLPAGINNTVEFRYQLMDADFTEWSTANTSFNDVLDEDNFSLTVEARYAEVPESLQQITRKSVSFEVDAVQGPGIMMRPRRPETKSRGEAFTLNVWVENMTDASAIEALVNYNNNVFELQGYQILSSNPFSAQQGANVEHSGAVGASTGVISFATALFGNPPPGINGSGNYARMDFRVRNGAPLGTSQIVVNQGSMIKNTSGTNITHQRISKDITIQ